jgi:hypothetical protein
MCSGGLGSRIAADWAWFGARYIFGPNSVQTVRTAQAVSIPVPESTGGSPFPLHSVFISMPLPSELNGPGMASQRENSAAPTDTDLGTRGG